MSRITRGAFNGDDPVIDFRHMLLKQADQKARMSSGHDDLWAPRGSFYFEHITRYPIFDAVALGGHLLAIWNHGLGPTKVDNDIIALKPPHMAVEDFAGPVLEFFVDLSSLSIANLLHDDLFCRLGGDAAKAAGVNFDPQRIADAGLRVELVCLWD